MASQKKKDESIWDDETYAFLVRSLDTNPELLDAMYGAGLLKRDTIESLSMIKATAERNKKVLKKVRKDSEEKFLKILRQNGQEHVANIIEKESDKMPMSEEHCRILQVKYEEICKFLDSRCGIVDALYSARVLSLAEVERIRACPSYYGMTSELINILSRKSDDSYNVFVDKLKEFGQNHVIHILTSGKEGVPPVSKKLLSLMESKKKDVMQNMDSRKSEFLPSLVSQGVFTDRDCERVNPCKYGHPTLTHEKSNDEIWQLLQRKPQSAYEKFIEVLKSTGQNSVALLLQGEEVSVKVQVACKKGVGDEAKRKQKATKFLTNTNDPLLRAFADIGVTLSREKGDDGIKLKFYSPEALEKLKKLLESGKANQLIDEEHRKEFERVRVESVQIAASDDEFKKCVENFDQHRIMTEGHRRTCRQLIKSPGVFNSIDLSDKFLKKLPFCDERRRKMLDEAFERDSHVKMLFEIVQHQPDSAFQQLVDALRDTKQGKLADLLEATAKQNEQCDWRPPGRAHTPHWSYGMTTSRQRSHDNDR